MLRRSPAFTFFLLLPLVCLAAAKDDARGGGAQPPVKSEYFDCDPGWDAVNNHVTPKKSEPVKQDFGYSPTTFAASGGTKGEIGGRIQRAARAAYYAETLPAPKTLNDK